MITAIQTLHAHRWDLSDLAAQQREPLLALLEEGGVICLPELPGPGDSPEYRALLDARWADPKAKNISHDPVRGLKGALGDAGVQKAMTGLLTGYQQQALALVHAIAPHYQSSLRVAPASLRLMKVEGRATSWRKDDSRLHIDAFPSRPNYGERILRVFHNLNPREPRVWRVGANFEEVAARFAPALPPYSAFKARALQMLKVTKSLRSAYDHQMLELHDAMKADMQWQADCPQLTVPFAPGSTWVCYSDQTSHAVMSGQFMLEQTLHLAVAAMREPRHAPLRVLESLAHHALV
jgi:hypothetical protein